CQHGCGIPVTF
nr:immunoglobulin light chain junction region [Macaca mulatta]